MRLPGVRAVDAPADGLDPEICAAICDERAHLGRGSSSSSAASSRSGRPWRPTAGWPSSSTSWPTSMAPGTRASAGPGPRSSPRLRPTSRGRAPRHPHRRFPTWRGGLPPRPPGSRSANHRPESPAVMWVTCRTRRRRPGQGAVGGEVVSRRQGDARARQRSSPASVERRSARACARSFRSTSAGRLRGIVGRPAQPGLVGEDHDLDAIAEHELISTRLVWVLIVDPPRRAPWRSRGSRARGRPARGPRARAR